MCPSRTHKLGSSAAGYCASFRTFSPNIKRRKSSQQGTGSIVYRSRILNQKGHQAEARDNRIICIVCASTWPSRGNSGIYQAAPLCPGIPPVLTDLFPGQARVAQRLSVSGLHITGVKVDPSHSLAHINGVTFCTTCGNYAVKIVRELAKGCRMKVSNPTKERNLKKLLSDRLSAGMTWPSPGVATPELSLIHI